MPRKKKTPDAEPSLADVTAETLYPQIRDVLLTHVRAAEKPWSKRSQAEQQDTIDAIEKATQHLIRLTCHAVTARGFGQIPVTLGDLAVKKKHINGKFVCRLEEENLVSLASYQDAAAVLVLCDPEEFFIDADPPEADPDQPELPTGEEDPDHDPETGEILEEEGA